MKLFGASIWKTVQSEIRTIDSVLNRASKPGKGANCQTAPSAATPTKKRQQKGVPTYPLSPNFIKTFATSGLPFLTFYEFNDLTGWCRDTYFTADHVAGYEDDIGKNYSIWTHEATSAYRRHIFLDDLSKDIKVSFEIPNLNTASWFPLRIRLFDSKGLYFQHDQKLVVERISDGRHTLTSWKKIPQLQDCLPRLHRQSCPAH